MTLELDDRPLVSPVCSFCKNLHRDRARACKAFDIEKSIPDEIWSGKNKHTEPVRGDQGIQFEKVDE